MSPKTILLFSVAYMGFVILLHIFGKVSSINKGGDPMKAAGNETNAEDLWAIKVDKKWLRLDHKWSKSIFYDDWHEPSTWT